MSVPPVSPAHAAGLVRVLDLTTLEADDVEARVEALCRQACAPPPGVPPCAAVCVWPALVPVAVASLRGTAVKVAAVAGGFPAGQIPARCKAGEAAWAVEAGAAEVDMVINRGLVAEGKTREVEAEVAAVRAACGSAMLKVILETGELPGPAAWENAAECAVAGGADMLKTSTGKGRTGASPEAVTVLCRVAARHSMPHRPLGVKVSGGVRDPQTALGYRDIAAAILGPDAATDPRRFRIGASTLWNALAAILAS